jgi:DedD protein
MPPDNLNDQEIQFKKRARRRLVGAIALVLLMVTILPMVLDDRASKTPPQEIAITIPSQDDSEFTSKIVPVAPENPAPQPEVREEVIDSQSADAGPVDVPVTIDAPVEKPQPKVEQPKPVATPAPAISVPTKKEIAKPVEKTVVAEKPVAKAEPAKADTFSVQIGVFSDPANVKQLQQKLATQNLKSYTEKLPTANGDKIRLRAGPFNSRAEAEKALAKAKDVGLVGMIVTNK